MATEPLKKYPFATGALDPRVLTGERGVTMLPLSVAMSELSRQFVASALIPSIAAGQSEYFTLTTPAVNEIRVSTIAIQGLYISGTFDIFRDGTFTGGTPVTIFNNNDRSPVATEAVFTGGITMSTPGTQAFATTNLIGTAANGNRVLAASTGFVGDKILKPNTTYIGRITNTDTAAMGPVELTFAYIEGNGYVG